MIKHLTCLVCPRGCHLSINDKMEVTGNFCARGIPYALQELKAPKRSITYAIVLEEEETTLAIKSSGPIPKELMFEVIAIIKKLNVKRPIVFNQVLIKNILNTGVDIISSEEKV